MLACRRRLLWPPRGCLRPPWWRWRSRGRHSSRRVRKFLRICIDFAWSKVQKRVRTRIDFNLSVCQRLARKTLSEIHEALRRCSFRLGFAVRLAAGRILGRIQGDHSTCSKLPFDFKTKVPFGLAWPSQTKVELRFLSQRRFITSWMVTLYILRSWGLFWELDTSAVQSYYIQCICKNVLLSGYFFRRWCVNADFQLPMATIHQGVFHWDFPTTSYLVVPICNHFRVKCRSREKCPFLYQFQGNDVMDSHPGLKINDINMTDLDCDNLGFKTTISPEQITQDIANNETEWVVLQRVCYQ